MIQAGNQEVKENPTEKRDVTTERKNKQEKQLLFKTTQDRGQKRPTTGQSSFLFLKLDIFQQTRFDQNPSKIR